jgi:surface antigen
MKRIQLIIKKLLPYLGCSALILALMIFGSSSEIDESGKPIASNFGDTEFVVTADQVSETYTVASITDTLQLASASTVSANYVTVDRLYEETGSIVSKDNNVEEKPIFIDTSDFYRGIRKYTVKDGDTLDSISELIGVSKDHIRWSNDMKKEDVTVGQELVYYPDVDGIIYKVKEDDTVDSLAEKYGSNKEEIIAYNDLEGKDLEVDSLIVLPGGDLPEKERPEYVAPAPVIVNPTPSYYSYSTDSGTRHGLTEDGSYAYWSGVYYSGAPGAAGNPGAFGNCTWFAWYWRNSNVAAGNLPESYRLPGGALGNGRDWAYSLGAAGFAVNRTPAYGAVIQSMDGWYGHVGVVVGVEEGVSITIQEMNYAGPNGMYNHVYQSTINWSDALGYNYIHGR